MDREYFYRLMQQDNQSDYEVYLRTHALLSCQKNFAELCNKDELQFQITHQLQELQMKLMAYTLLDIDEFIQQCNTNQVVTLFARVHKIQNIMIEALSLLEAMSPKEYQEIRLQLGNGSGITSPGFRTLLKMFQPLWESYQECYLQKNGLTIRQVYDTQYQHNDAYVVAEALLEFEARYRRFLQRHFDLIERTIGGHAKSLKGHDVERLQQRIHTPIYPELWEVRNLMTDDWGMAYGVKRESICPHGKGGQE